MNYIQLWSKHFWVPKSYGVWNFVSGSISTFSDQCHFHFYSIVNPFCEWFYEWFVFFFPVFRFSRRCSKPSVWTRTISSLAWQKCFSDRENSPNLIRSWNPIRNIWHFWSRKCRNGFFRHDGKSASGVHSLSLSVSSKLCIWDIISISLTHIISISLAYIIMA